jgi:short-subunit dehydrogenase
VNLAGRTVLLTGATGGLGQAIARALAARGASLVLTGRRAEVLEPLAAELGARAVVCDLADRAAVERLAAEEASAADVLVANAGLPASGRIEEYPVEHIDRALDVNLRAPVLLARAAAIAMEQRGGGHIVLMSSMAGKQATVRSALYSATKYGLRGFAAGLRQDLAGSGVGVSVVFPGPIREAGMFAESGAHIPRVGTKSPRQVSRAVVRAIERNVPEVSVAPVFMRLGGALAALSPRVSDAISRHLPVEETADAIAAGQAEKR